MRLNFLNSLSTRLLGAVMLCSVLVIGTLPTIGCNGSTVAQNIVSWTPALEQGVATVNSTAALLLPADAPIFVEATIAFDAGATEVATLAKAYLANPTASVLAQLQTAVVTLNQTVNAALLKVAGVKDLASQQHALNAINVVATVVATILALVQSISSKAAVAQMASDSTIKLAQVRPFIDARDMQPVAELYGTTVDGFYAYEARAGF